MKKIFLLSMITLMMNANAYAQKMDSTEVSIRTKLQIALKDKFITCQEITGKNDVLAINFSEILEDKNYDMNILNRGPNEQGVVLSEFLGDKTFVSNNIFTFNLSADQKNVTSIQVDLFYSELADAGTILKEKLETVSSSVIESNFTCTVN